MIWGYPTFKKDPTLMLQWNIQLPDWETHFWRGVGGELDRCSLDFTENQDSMGISGSNWWRYVSTICLAIFSGAIPLHRPYFSALYMESVPMVPPILFGSWVMAIEGTLLQDASRRNWSTWIWWYEWSLLYDFYGIFMGFTYGKWWFNVI